MKERLMPILSLVVLFALVGSMAYFGQAGQQEVKESEVIATTSVEKVEQEVVESDDFLERVEKPELVLTKVGAGMVNNYNYATLDKYSVEEDGISVVVSTDAGIADVYYELLNDNGDIVYKGAEGVSFGVNGDTHNVFFNKIVFNNDLEQDVKLNPEWVNCKIRFHLITGRDTSVVVEPIEM